MINMASTLGASVPGFNRSGIAERKPDSGSSTVVAIQTNNPQSLVTLEGGQKLAGSQQVLHSDSASSATVVDSAAGVSSANPVEGVVNEPRHREEDDATLRRQERREDNSERLKEDEVSLSERVEQNLDKGDALQNKAKTRVAENKTQDSDAQLERAQEEKRSAVSAQTREGVESKQQLKSEQREVESEFKLSERDDARRDADIRRDIDDSVSSESEIEEGVPASVDTFGSSNSRDNDSDDSERRDESQDLSRQEREGLRSFQQVAEVNAFEATGTTIDVSA
ncbi:MAG: hypothetical protein KUG82_02865 [Pseudomonadales bacterium]|nr:hypothetical protein [Pseudomonadales bacterium]